MKILFFNTNIGYGGASKMMVDIANFLSHKNDVTFLTFRNADVLQPLGDKVSHVHMPLCKCNIKALETIRQIAALRKYIKKEGFDLAIAFLHPANYMLTIASKFTKTKVLLSERADPHSRLKNGGVFVHFIEHILHMADAYVFQSDGAKNLYPEKCQKKGTVIVNSVPDAKKEFCYSGVREKRIVHVARMELIQKRQDVMLKAFKSFSNKYPEYVLEFYGDGPDEDAMKNLASQLGVGDKVKFMGAQSRILEKIKTAEMFVLTSDYEGIPNALLEAMAIGIPCISTDCSPGGARMIIKDNINGFIVPCGDAEALFEKMDELARDEKRRNDFSGKAKTGLNDFKPENVYKKWTEFVNTIAN